MLKNKKKKRGGGTEHIHTKCNHINMWNEYDKDIIIWFFFFCFFVTSCPFFSLQILFFIQYLIISYILLLCDSRELCVFVVCLSFYFILFMHVCTCVYVFLSDHESLELIRTKKKDKNETRAQFTCCFRSKCAWVDLAPEYFSGCVLY